MPLDSRKIQHIQSVIPQTWTGRTRTVVFVYDNAGTFSYVAQTVIWRRQDIIDPQIPDLSGGVPGVPADVRMIAALTINFTGVVYIADTATATSAAVAAAEKYEIIETLPTGMIPGGTHYTVALRRLR